MNECRLFLDSHPDDFNTAQPRHLVQFLNDEVAEFVPSIVRVECLNRLQELCEAEGTVDLQTVEDLLHDELYHAFEFGGGGGDGGGGGGGGGLPTAAAAAQPAGGAGLAATGQPRTDRLARGGGRGGGPRGVAAG